MSVTIPTSILATLAFKLVKSELVEVRLVLFRVVIVATPLTLRKVLLRLVIVPIPLFRIVAVATPTLI